MTQVTTAFLGVAHIHTPGFVKMLAARGEAGEVAVRAVWDRDGERAQNRAAELAGAHAVADVDAILSDAEITSVVICSETVYHKELVIAAAQAGKDIFCEKPLGLGAADATAIASAITSAGVRFQTGFMQRSSGAHQFIKREVAAGNLGKLTRAHYTNAHGAALLGWFDTDWRWLADAKLAGGGALLDMGAHPLDLVIDTFKAGEGEITHANATFANKTGRYGTEIDEAGTALLGFESGFAATVSASWLESSNLHVPVAVYGTEGQILVHGGKVFYQSSHVDGMDGKEPLADSQLPKGAPHAFEIFWDVLLGKPTTVSLIPVSDAAYGSTIMERLYNSAGRSTTTGV